jgi:hypothetical protein
LSNPYDPRQRTAAAAIQNAHPNWLIMYGPHSRMFYAYPLFPAPRGALLAATSLTDLLAAMHLAELTSGHAPRPRQPPPA